MNSIQRRQVLALGAAASLAGLGTAVHANSAPALGLSLPLTGTQSVVGRELLVGYEIAQMLHAPDLALKVLDDAGSTDKTVANIAALGKNASVVSVSGIVGTPNAQAALPIAQQTSLPVIGLRSGLAALRNGAEGVYHLRTSFETEIDTLLQSLRGVYSNIIVIYSDDTFGIAMRDHITVSLAESNLLHPADPITVELNFPIDRANKTPGRTTTDAVKTISKAFSSRGATKTITTAVVMLTLAGATVDMVTQMRRAVLVAPVYAMSFTATAEVATRPNPALVGMGLVNVFPFPWASVQQMVAQFRQAAVSTKRETAINSLTSFEGYFYGAVAAQAWRQAGGRDRMVKVMDKGLQLAGTPIVFDPKRVGYNFKQVVYKSASGRLRT